MDEGEVDKLVKGLVQQVSQVSCASDTHSHCTNKCCMRPAKICKPAYQPLLLCNLARPNWGPIYSFFSSCDAICESCIGCVQDGLEDHFKSKAGKSFKTNYQELWDKVMQECQSADLLFDNYLLDKISYLVIALSW